MARYTIELKDVVLSHNIFDFSYPFYDERKKPEFEEKFIRHFYFREIGCETVDRFKHYLQDKMLTVFPYYNELFNAANIEYSVLNNYNLTEEFTTTRENVGKSSGVLSAVAQSTATQETESTGNRVTDTDGQADTISNETDTLTEHAETVTTENGSTENSSNTTVNGESTKTVSESVDENKREVRKYLDTPQGKVDLSNTDYLTNLTDTTQDNAQERNAEESDTNSQTTNTSGTGESSNNGTSTTDGTKNGEKTSSVKHTTTGKETTADTMQGSVTDEQKATQDSNTRTYTDSRQTETHKLTRIGNIGVDTDSDMIEKHIRLQKTLRQIELLFFAECEDLFMLVY